MNESFENAAPLLYVVQCRQHHRWHTHCWTDPCPTCGGEPTNAYVLPPALLPTAAELLDGDVQ